MPLIALVGKAVTFDSGGISLKPAATMHEMKFDMCGGAAVIEAIAALAELRAPVRVLGLIGATENLPSGTAVKPGDIVRALDGTTIEVNNTDAEGRLVLADCISYARREGARAARRRRDAHRRDRGRARVDVRRPDEQRRRVGRGAMQDAAQRTGELVWRMPLHRDYAEMIKGRYGQIVNSTTKREATALTAGEFLHHFAGDVPWAHLDIAGTAYDVRRPYFADRGATGYGVRLLVDLARNGSRRLEPDQADEAPQRADAALNADPSRGEQPDRGAAPGVDRARHAAERRRDHHRRQIGQRPADPQPGATAGPSSTSTPSSPNTIRTGG